MNAFGTSTTVQPTGDVFVAGVPFAPGTEVEIVISAKRQSAGDFAQSWRRVCDQLRQAPQLATLSDQDIQQELKNYRSGR